MKKMFFLGSIFWMLFLQNIAAQISPKELLLHNQSNSYVGVDKFPNNFEEDILFEISAQPNFYFHYKNFLPRLWLEMDTEVTIKLRDSTYHVMNPRFRLALNFYYDLSNGRLSKKNYSKLAYFTIGHHSNGQDEPFLKPNTNDIDFVNGDFGTDYFRGGLVLEKFIGANKTCYFLQNYQVEYHPVFIGNSKRKHLYSLFDEYRIGGKWQWIIGNADAKNRYSATLKTQVLLEHITEGATKDKVIIDLRLAYQPGFLKMSGFWIFAQGYYGEDYYQIYFVNTLKLFRVGVEMRNWGNRKF